MRFIFLNSSYKIIGENIINRPKSFKELENLLEKTLKNNYYTIYFYRKSDKDYFEINNNIYQEVEEEDILFILNIDQKDLDKSEFSLNLNKLNPKDKEKIEENYKCILCDKNINDQNPYFCYICQNKICEQCLKDWDKKRKQQNAKLN